ncbi:hypothetical protein [Okeania sp. KiyG1]|uniref:hypothetical protein n=1 Tax=Okeania sp. KiyG1 TaxID=2720165 RepID=UPI001923DFD5|nr:hypothetical protein [Okeania sp. KiyG1]
MQEGGSIFSCTGLGTNMKSGYRANSLFLKTMSLQRMDEKLSGQLQSPVENI